jgi:hypothetical protein
MRRSSSFWNDDVETLGFSRLRETVVSRDEASASRTISDLNQRRSELKRIRGCEGMRGEKALGTFAHDTDGLDLRPASGQRFQTTEDDGYVRSINHVLACQAPRRAHELGSRKRPNDDLPVGTPKRAARLAAFLLHHQGE